MEYYKVRNCTIKRCPFEWQNLLPTDDANKRECLVCDRMVRLVHDYEELEKLTLMGECVAVLVENSKDDTWMGISSLGEAPPPEHYDLELQSSLRRYKAGQHSPEDLRVLFFRYLDCRMRSVALAFYKEFIAQGNIPDFEMIKVAGRHGISLPEAETSS